ncbi:MAG: ferritin-like domain-containing protein [Comamonadaceae bacterium]|nr:ferritin-like domain-containing protein [Comamonadaceae bacterium]
MELRQRALEVLCLCAPIEKAEAAMHLHAHASQASIAPLAPILPEGTVLPGHPAKPELLHHTAVARRSPATVEGRVILMHAIAHIEFNAINLALDAIWRFDDMPRQYYLDWLQVAGEEGKHFLMIRKWLQDQGHDYGDFPAHQGLWTMCEKTAGDITARMALVPRTMEARGLDATPQIQAKLRQVGTPDALTAVEILDVILKEEVNHVSIGNHWYRFLCQRNGLEPQSHYTSLTQKYEAPRPRPPFNTQARQAAGFTEEEIAWLEQH